MDLLVALGPLGASWTFRHLLDLMVPLGYFGHLGPKCPKYPRGTIRSKRCLKFQETPKDKELPKGPTATKRFKRYLKVQDIYKGKRGT